MFNKPEDRIEPILSITKDNHGFTRWCVLNCQKEAALIKKHQFPISDHTYHLYVGIYIYIIYVYPDFALTINNINSSWVFNWFRARNWLVSRKLIAVQLVADYRRWISTSPRLVNYYSPNSPRERPSSILRILSRAIFFRRRFCQRRIYKSHKSFFSTSAFKMTDLSLKQSKRSLRIHPKVSSTIAFQSYHSEKIWLYNIIFTIIK